MANKVTDIQIIDSSGRDGEPKMWVKVLFDNGCEWYPKITEIGKICSGIGLAEDKKYPNLDYSEKIERDFNKWDIKNLKD